MNSEIIQYRLKTTEIQLSKNIGIAQKIVSELEEIGIDLQSIFIEEYYKFENSHMIEIIFKVNDNIKGKLINSLMNLSDDWLDISKREGEISLILDIRGKHKIYHSVEWACLSTYIISDQE